MILFMIHNKTLIATSGRSIIHIKKNNDEDATLKLNNEIIKNTVFRYLNWSNLKLLLHSFR